MDVRRSTPISAPVAVLSCGTGLPLFRKFNGWWAGGSSRWRLAAVGFPGWPGWVLAGPGLGGLVAAWVEWLDGDLVAEALQGAGMAAGLAVVVVAAVVVVVAEVVVGGVRVR